MRVYKLDFQDEGNSSRPYQGLAYDAVHSGPQPDQTIQRHPDQDSMAQDEVVQMVKAYRVGTSASNYKIAIDPKTGMIAEFKGGRSGIDISFESRDHAQYYLKTKSSDPQAKLVEWEMDDTLYAMIKRKMGLEVKGDVPASWIAPKKGKPGKWAKIWTKIQKISTPVNSTDQYVTQNKLIAPHFGLDWIPIFNEAGKGKASVSGHDEEEEEVAAPAPQFSPDDWIALSIDGGGWLPIQYKELDDYTSDAKKFKVISKANAIAAGHLEEGDFEEPE